MAQSPPIPSHPHPRPHPHPHPHAHGTSHPTPHPHPGAGDAAIETETEMYSSFPFLLSLPRDLTGGREKVCKLYSLLTPTAMRGEEETLTRMK